ncbi:MAG TPA: uroporphyrinogen decarboxylase family protein [Bacteroidota bacterium]|nr:uroporphyrinogen decarboxylase family protein [Bacteroidota bacterium]
MMTSRERVLRAFGKAGGQPDRVPVQFDLCRSLTDTFGRELGLEPTYALSYYEDLTYRISANEIRTRLGSDVVVVGGTVARGFTPGVVADTVTTNEFGMQMKPTALYVEVVKCPLEHAESIEDIDGYAFPDAYAPGRFDAAKRDIDRFANEFYVIGDAELSLFELAWHLTGLEKYLVALMTGEPWLEKLNDRVEAWTTGLVLQMAEAGVDAIWLGEDLGTQTSLLIDPDLWRERFKPRHARIIRTLKERHPGISIIFHSDGAVAPLLDDFIELGVDVYNPVQPNVPGSDPVQLKKNYGGRIAFFGGIDQQALLPSGDLGAIRENVRYMARTLGANGGYLLAPAHIVQPDVAPESLRAMIEAAKE